MNLNVGVVTFAGGSPRWYFAGYRLIRQCRKSGRIVHARLLTPRGIRNFIDIGTKEFIKKNSKGYGYWVWKPYVVRNFLRDNPNIDCVLFLDAGCELQINEESIKIWNQYLNVLNSFDCLTFDNGQPEKNWSKMELINFLNPAIEKTESNQLAAGVFFMKRNFALDFCEQWISIMQEKDFFYITDEVNKEIQLETFRQHRYDQSVFSLLMKEHERNLTLTGDNEIHFPGKWESRRTHPIWTIRNASLVPTLNRGVIAKAIRLFEKLLHVFFIMCAKLLKAK